MDELVMRRLQESSGAGGAWPSAGCCLSLDPNGTVTWAAQAVRDLGWAPEELVGRNVSVVVPRLGHLLGPAQRAIIMQGHDAGATVVDVGLQRDGRVFEAAISVAARFSPARDVQGLTIVVRDVGHELEQRRSRRLARDRESVLVLGRDLAVRHATRPAAELLGLRATDMFPGLGEGLIHPADRLPFTEAVERLLVDPHRVERVTVRLRGAGGAWRTVETTLSNCLDSPDLHGLVARLRDVSDHASAEDEARLSAALHRAMVESSEEAVVVTGEDGTTRYVNTATARILGLPTDDLYRVALPGLLGLHGPGPARDEIVYRHPDGFDRILAVTRSPLGDDGVGLGSLLTIADVTESRLSERDLRRRALYDPLTGLPNRYLVRDRLEMAAARQGRMESGCTGVLFIDLDGFKPINDTHGHDAGDELLQQVAERLSAAVRTTDTVGRVGGDEFVVVCEDVDDAAISVVASRVLAALADPFQLSQGTVGIAASIGIALSPPHPFDQLLQEADAAMYRAKRAGGGDTIVAAP
jgi:diguanylate cyclase (GGDEF)-like protein/PAS domain S-box-containing protein